MKTLIYLFITLLSSVSWSQSAVSIVFFSAEKVNDNVQLSWGIDSGNLCYGTKVLHSTDVENFKEIGRIDGICGDSTEYRIFNFTDRHPTLNSINYYRIVFNNTVYSEVISLNLYKLNDDHYLVKPQPISGQGELIFNNPNHLSYEFELYDSFGNKVRQFMSNAEVIPFESHELEPGTYYFLLQYPEKGSIRGQIMVVK